MGGHKSKKQFASFTKPRIPMPFLAFNDGKHEMGNVLEIIYSDALDFIFIQQQAKNVGKLIQVISNPLFPFYLRNELIAYIVNFEQPTLFYRLINNEVIVQSTTFQ
jgi:hypothetical protein